MVKIWRSECERVCVKHEPTNKTFHAAQSYSDGALRADDQRLQRIASEIHKRPHTHGTAVPGIVLESLCGVRVYT